MPGGPLNFDRVAGIYDDTRTIQPATLHRVVELLEAELAGRGLCLEIGVGTGRIGLPLGRAGVPLVGVDISAGMLNRLVRKQESRPAVTVVRADAGRLPFRAGCFAAAVACQVFHVMPNWRAALKELFRVVVPGGVVLVDFGAWSPLSTEVRRRFAEAVGIDRPFAGAQDSAELEAELVALGAGVRRLEEIEEAEEVVVDSLIGNFEQGLNSPSWQVDEPARRAAAARLRRWAAETYGDAPQAVTRIVRWSAYDLPG